MVRPCGARHHVASLPPPLGRENASEPPLIRSLAAGCPSRRGDTKKPRGADTTGFSEGNGKDSPEADRPRTPHLGCSAGAAGAAGAAASAAGAASGAAASGAFFSQPTRPNPRVRARVAREIRMMFIGLSRKRLLGIGRCGETRTIRGIWQYGSQRIFTKRFRRMPTPDGAKRSSEIEDLVHPGGDIGEIIPISGRHLGCGPAREFDLRQLAPHRRPVDAPLAQGHVEALAHALVHRFF